MSAQNGGSAFPSDEIFDYSTGTAISQSQGMSLRDYFAAKAMPNLISLCQDGDGAWDCNTVAQNAYFLADAMLAERAKP